MNRYPSGAPSRAGPSTLCQKCLQRGHYSYECKVALQDRPYIGRPSRSQQLSNPDLAPKLTFEAAPLERAGLADKILEERSSKRQRVDENGRAVSRSSSPDSVATISTNRSPSRSPTPPPPKKIEDRPEHSSREHRHSSRRHRRHRSKDRERDSSRHHRRSQREHGDRERRHRDKDRHRSRSPRRHKENGSDSRRRGERSRDRQTSRSASPARRIATTESRPAHREPPPNPRPGPPRERSLSPFSKRVALTRAMNS